jgi:hypothetical protein
MSKTFTRVQNEKLVAAQKDMTGSITEQIDALYKNAFAVTMSTAGDRTVVNFQIQDEDGSIRNRCIYFSAVLFDVKED